MMLDRRTFCPWPRSRAIPWEGDIPVLNTRNYEMMFVVGADLGEEQLDALLQRIQRYLETAQAEVLNTKSWGLRRLAYTLKGQREGRYYLAQFAAPTQTVNDLDRNMRLIEEVLRHIIVQVDEVDMPEEPSAAEDEARPTIAEAEVAVAETAAVETPATEDAVTEDAEAPAEA